MKAEDVKHITVLGAGLMGHGITQSFAQAGFPVTMVDIKEEFVQKGLENIKWSLGKFLEKGKLSQTDYDAILNRISISTDRDAAIKETDLIVEAIPEILSLKQEVFTDIEAKSPKHTILATNTSSLPITDVAATTKHPEKVVGMHFFSPVVRMNIVEIIKGEKTSDEAAKIIYALTEKMGKEPVMCNKDVPGFIANGIQMFPLNFVGQLIDMGKFTPEEIDSATTLKLGLPMGTFGLLDFVGIDVVYNVLKFMTTRIPGMKMAKCLEEKVQKGELGAKTGKGFYEHPGNRWQRPTIWSQELADKFDPQLVVVVGINRAAELVADDVASPADIDKTMKLGFNQPVGTLELADSLGLDAVVEKLEFVAKEYNDFYAPHPLLKQMIKDGKLGMKTKQGFFKY
ncbi:MAG: 3-hydroxyacyl-CoA dehydrogenase [Candidatus Hermodarchaeia archaeon]|jgi:enoyl-CoA hydratase/3-hydroxyacyl-CoA dehydrogenase